MVNGDRQGAQDSDESLVVRICNGDHQAFAELVQRHSGLFFHAAYRMCANNEEAEDIVQDAFLKLWDKPDVFDPAKGAKFTTWFYRVVINLAIDRTRRRKPQSHPDVLDYMADKTPLADEQYEKKGREASLESAIQRLPERQRAALNLCFYEGLSNKDAAEILGVGVKGLESLLMRAKKELKQDLKTRGLIEEEERTGS